MQKLSKHYLRQWRRFRGLTQEQAAAHLDITQATLSRIEQFIIPYNQGLLEKAAAAYSCEPSDILAADPNNPNEMFQLDQILREAGPETRAEILGYARGLLDRKAGELQSNS